MKQKKNYVLEKDLVLVGAGHSNIEVLRSLGKNPISGVRVTLITNKLEAIYSGMVPGYIEGQYSWSDIVIDLIKMSYEYDFRIIHSSVLKIDSNENKVYLKKRSSIKFDFLSINIGIKSKSVFDERYNRFFLSLKPVSEIKFLVEKTLSEKKNDRNNTLVLIGAGAAGVEVALAFRKRFNKLSLKNRIVLVSNKNIILEGYKNSVRRACETSLKKNNIDIFFNTTVTKINKEYIEINNTEKIYNTYPLLSTSSEPSEVLKISNLPLTEKGYLSIENTLLLRGINNIFASGDTAELNNHKNIKAGVFAVKQGKVLANNIRCILTKRKLQSYKPQKFYLSLIGLGDKEALANKSIFTFKGKFFWRIKKNIDKRFIKKYSFTSSNKKELEKEFSSEPYDRKMQCEGCGNKIPQYVLNEVFSEKTLAGSPDAEEIPFYNNLTQTVDVISSLVKDPYLLGKIAAKHAANDLLAANSRPISAQMIIGLPPAKNEINIRDLWQIKSGAKSILDQFKCKISGGHSFSYNGDQIIVGFSLTGKKEKIVKRKKLINAKIYLTGKIGSALVFAGIKEKKINGIHYKDVSEAMVESNYVLNKILIRNSINVKTDVSGFGLAIHLYNLFLRHPILNGAEIFLEKIPLYEGARLAIEKSVTSSLNASNKEYIKDKLLINNKNNKLLNAIFDPQTAGGFIFVCEQNNEKLLKELTTNKINFAHIGNIKDINKKINVL